MKIQEVMKKFLFAIVLASCIHLRAQSRTSFNSTFEEKTSNYSVDNSFTNEDQIDSKEKINDDNRQLNKQELVAANDDFDFSENIQDEIGTDPLSYYGTLKIDDDGSGFSHNDPNHDAHTWWQPNGEDLNADVDSYVVVPGYLQKKYGIKPGDIAKVTVYFKTSDPFKFWTGPNEPCDASNLQGTEYLDWISIISVCNVGDIGPDDKGVGEVSVAEAKYWLGFGISDINGVGPVPTWNGTDCAPIIKINYYPSGS